MKAQAEFQGTERFLIQRRLGAGSFGVVYQAYDRERGTVVALKALREINAEDLYKFKREFRALADITHPNLVTLYELISDGDQWFFTMELVQGVNLLKYLRGDINIDSDVTLTNKQISSGNKFKFNQSSDSNKKPIINNEIAPIGPSSEPPIDGPTFEPYTEEYWQQLRAVFMQLTEGVSALHQAGKLHKDLKPSNVLVTPTGRVVILDFGLVADLSARRFEQHIEIAGTPAYMSPEQGSVQSLTAATDWYSVGVILYQAITGYLPFEGIFSSPLIEKLKYDAEPPRKLVPQTPADLDSLCQSLLCRDPKQRPTGIEVHNILANHSSNDFGSADPLKHSGSLFLDHPELIGREEHLIALQEILAHAIEKIPQTAFIYGPSGMGKSMLVEYFLEDLQHTEPEAIVLTGRCYEQESVPYKAFDGVIDTLSSYLQSLTNTEIEQFLPLDVQAISRLFPVLSRVKAINNADRSVLEIQDVQELRRRAFAALKEMLARFAAKRLLVIFIDDLQWGDLDSAALLGEILHTNDPPPLLFLGSYRSEEINISPFLKAFLTPQSIINGEISNVHNLAVEKLTLAEAKKLALTLLTQNSRDKHNQEIVNNELNNHAQAIAQESDGIPFFVTELVRYLQAYGEEIQHNNKRSNGLIANLDEVIQTRVGRLPEDAQRLLKVIAVAGQPLERAIAKQAAHLMEQEQATLAQLRSSHLIRLTSTSEQVYLETYHDRIRETVVAHLSDELLQEHHLTLASILESLNQSDPERLLMHYQQAGKQEKTAQYAIIAAEQAAKALAFDHAARLYELALELKPGSEGQHLLVKLADALSNAGRSAEAAGIYLFAAENAQMGERLELQRRAADHFFRSGHIDEGLAVIKRVLNKIGLKMAKTPMGALLSLMVRRVHLFLRGLKFRERDAKEISQEEIFKIDTCWTVSQLAVVDLIGGADFHTRYLLYALKAGDAFRISRALTAEVGFSAFNGWRSYKRTESLRQMAISLAERVGHPYTSAFTALHSGTSAWLEGRWQVANQMLDRAEKIFLERCTGVTWEIQVIRLFSTNALFWLGETAEMSRRLPSYLKQAQDLGDLLAQTDLLTRLGYMVSLVANETEKAKQQIDSAIERWSKKRFFIQHYYALIGKGEIALYCGNGQEVLDLLSEQWTTLNRSLTLRTQILLIETLFLRARGAIAAAVNAKQDVAASALLNAAERDIKQIEKEQTPYGTGFVKSIRAAILVQQGRSSEAISLLSAAAESFQKNNMLLYAAAARRRRGQLLNSDQGRAEIAAVDSWMSSQRVINIERMMNMLMPGRWPA